MTKSATAARSAYQAHDWQGVLDALESQSNLSADDLVLKGDALYWTGSFDDSLEALEGAYSGLVAEGRPSEAGRVACLLAYLALRRQTFSVAGGWIARAEHLLEGEAESVGHVWLNVLHMGKAMFVDGDLEAAMRLSDEVLRVATSVGSKSGESLAMSFRATAMANAGDWKDAMGLVDEATVMAMAMGDDLRMTSDVYCNTISLCRNLGDYRRAGEWTEEAERWMHSNSVTAYTGACAVHRAELKLLHGSWQEAEDEARQACVGLERFHVADYVGLGRYQIGEIRRRMGDFELAQRSFEQAYENGNDAQPGLSLLMADRGDVDGAYQSITSAIGRHLRDQDNPAAGGPSRARLLPALIEIALAAGDEQLAASSIDDLEEIAEAYDSQVWSAAAAESRGALALRTGSPEEAIDVLGRAWRMWQDADLPYELGRTRALLGEARRAAGDAAGAELELKAALSALEALGATIAVQRVRELLGQDGEIAASSGARLTRTFMFTDIVTSTDLLELIGDAAWHDLLQWHDRTLRAAISSAGGEEVSHTGDGLFAAFADARAAVECAVDIQRRLLRHRHEAGFAPLVRIGLHTAEANRHDGDYSGAGVHAAARIGAIAEGEEVVISAEALASAGKLPYPVSDQRSVSLKGITDPIEVHTIDWH